MPSKHKERVAVPAPKQVNRQTTNNSDRIRFGKAARLLLPRLASKWANDNHEA